MIYQGEQSLVPPAVDTLPINLAILDDDGTILATNQAWKEFGERNGIAVRPDTLGVNYLEVTDQADDDLPQRVAAGLRDVIAGAAELVEVEYPCHSPDEKRWFIMRAAPFALDGQHYVAVAHIDVTGRVRNRRELEKFRRVVETAGHAVFITTPEQEITYVNPAFEEITGYSPEEAIGRTPDILKSGEMDEKYYEELWETILAGEVWEDLVINRQKSGELYYAKQTIAPVFDADGNPEEFIAIQVEITQSQEIQTQLQKLGTLLRHDMRNDLNVVQANAEMIQRDAPEVASYAETISETIDSLLGTVEKGRKLQKFLDRKTEPDLRDIVPIVETVVESQRSAFADVPISLESPGELTALCVGELGGALTELIENSIVHNSDPTVAVTVESNGEWVDIRIADDGPGIAEMEHVSLDSETVSELYHDTGFGLNLAYWIARRSGGRLDFEDNDSQGATVTVRLPDPQ